MASRCTRCWAAAGRRARDERDGRHRHGTPRMFDASMRDELHAWLTRDRAVGGVGLPPGLAAERALALQCFIDGLAMRSAREPDLDRDQLRSAVQDMVDKVTRQPDIAAPQQEEA
ncbi:MAG: TetR family transcriptional regulator C-terminal domain-containing protein [Gammaproteobacteria bacterium]|nr:TetR family transcriptional regulator C-terminal domain-containing protein [Gammaproteobacteria bacterium]MDH5226431.1 TetR family transcriptional regulator C-terminal domain-containing protein [Gammaproteobacteria bacterium]